MWSKTGIGFCLTLAALAFPAIAGPPPLPFEHALESRTWDAAKDTVVVYNTALEISSEIALEYIRARGIPADNLIGLACSTEETIGRDEFEESIRNPLRAEFAAKGWWSRGKAGDPAAAGNRKRILALVHGIPLRIAPPSEGAGDGQIATTAASVDSDLALLGARNPSYASAMSNPYFGQDMRFLDFPDPDLLLVARLDGPDPETARRLFHDALAAEKSGLWGMAYIDLANDDRPGYARGDHWLKDASKFLRDAGIPVVTDRHQTRFPINYPLRDPILYLGWYTQNCDGPFLNPAFEFPTGAIAVHIHSYSASTLRDPDNCWTSPLLKRGAAASLGNVWEPFLSNTTNLDVFADRLLKGYTLAESAAMATPAISWMTVVVGDPLYRPFGPGRGLDDRKSGAAYKAAHLIARLHEDGDPVAHFEALTEAGDRLSSPELLETVGLALLDRGDHRRAGEFFVHAHSHYAEPADRIRTWLHQADLARLRNDRRTALLALDSALKENQESKDPALEAALALRNELDPPPPPKP